MATTEIEQQQLLIGGEWKAASSGRSYEKRNPFTGESVGTTAAASVQDVRAAVDAAAAAFPEWSATPPQRRQQLLELASQLMIGRQQEFAAIVAEETGATFGWGMFNVELAAGMLAEAGSHAGDLSAQAIPSAIPGKEAQAVRQPVGVVVGIAPWNAPVIVGTRAVASPLGLGNTVVLKASEECPRTHAGIARVLQDAGLPAGAINLITNDPADAAEIVQELIEHPAVRRVNFTGSSRVGRIVAEHAGRHLKRVLLELGGKAPMIVLGDADLERAARAATFGAFMHQGQICMSTERIVIDRSVADEFADQLGARARALKVGDPRDPETEIGPLVNEASLTRVGELVEDAVSKGATVVAGGHAVGPCYEPTVLMGVTAEMRIYGEESFGPVVSIVPVDGADEAVRVANDTEYGLSAAIFSSDIDAARAIARRLETGMCHINDTTVHDEPQMPFGGVKASGWGRFGGTAALQEFTELRWITEQLEPREYPI
jgi:acyl-CoA reductase-like NAD-dependent aldehyde dehydrogenase